MSQSARENLELQTELQLLRQTFRSMVPSGRLVMFLLGLLFLSLCYSFTMLKLVWLWVLLSFSLSFFKGLLAFQVQMRRLGPLLATTVDPVNLRLTLVDRDFNESDYEALLGLDDSVSNKTKGRGAEARSKLPCTTISADWLEEASLAPGFTQECSICLERFVAGDTVRALACGHIYHLSCLDTWLDQALVCPICKALLLE